MTEPIPTPPAKLLAIDKVLKVEQPSRPQDRGLLVKVEVEDAGSDAGRWGIANDKRPRSASLLEVPQDWHVEKRPHLAR